MRWRRWKESGGAQARLDELDADVERQRREKRELDIEIAIRKGALELLGKEPGADPENLTNREKTLLVKTVSETLGVTARASCPWSASRAARTITSSSP